MARSTSQLEKQLLFTEGALSWTTGELTTAKQRIEELEEVIRQHLIKLDIIEKLLEKKESKHEDIKRQGKGKKAPAEGSGADS